MIQDLFCWNPWIQLILGFSVLQLNVHVEKFFQWLAKILSNEFYFQTWVPKDAF